MALSADRVQETSTTTGTGAVVLAGAASPSLRTFGSQFADGALVSYVILNQAVLSEWERGIGTYSSGSDSIARTYVGAGSNGTSPVNFSAGTKSVLSAPPPTSAGAAYSATQVYAPGDTVTSGGSTWYSMAVSLNSTPSTSNANWAQLGVGTPVTFPIAISQGGTGQTTAAAALSALGAQAALGFTPVQEGTGIGQLGNIVKIGWSASGLKCTVDVTDQGLFAMQPWVAANFATAAQGAKADAAVQPNTQPTLSGLVTTPVANGWGWQAQMGGAIKLGLFINSDGTPGLVNTNSWQQLYFLDGGSLQYTGLFSAENFSGSSSGTNTGDQDLSGLQPKLGFTPVQQGGGPGQGTNKIYIGWSGSALKLGVDSSDQGVFAMQSWVSANFAPAANRPAVYVQSSDPGAVADGSLWVW